MRQIDFLEQRLGAIVTANCRLELSVKVDMIGLYLGLRDVVWRRPRHEHAADELSLQPQFTRKPDLYKSQHDIVKRVN